MNVNIYFVAMKNKETYVNAKTLGDYIQERYENYKNNKNKRINTYWQKNPTRCCNYRHFKAGI